MLLNPSTYFTAQAEIDRVVGAGRVEARHLGELPYLAAVLRETLRLSPTAPAFTRGVRPENKEEKVTVAGGKFEIARDTPVVCLLGKIQRDPAVFGDDAEEFRPERMLDENFEKLPKNAWKVRLIQAASSLRPIIFLFHPIIFLFHPITLLLRVRPSSPAPG